MEEARARSRMEYEKHLVGELEDISRNPGDIQDKLLVKILEKNVATGYFQRHQLSADKNIFRQRAPVISYEDIKEDIHRVANGDSSPVLCVDRMSDIFTSSGTSGGEHKLFPKVVGHYRLANYCLGTAVLNQHLPGLEKGKGLYFLYVRKPKTTPGGLPAYPAMTGYYNSMEFRNRPYDNFTSPIEVTLCADNTQASYCHLLCGLIHSQEVVKLGSFFASVFMRSIRSLEVWWKDLCKDLRNGTLNERITDPAAREAVGKFLQPNPELSDAVEQACCSGNWKGIIRKLWPNAKVIETVITGAMEQYIGTINYLSDGLPVASLLYGASEACLGVNLDPLCKPSDISYMLLLQFNYYEFLPLNRGSDDDTEANDVLELVDVKQGQEYELVITTDAGLYRYRMGDVLKVVGFHNKAPLFSFVCRRNVLLSIDSDKTDEKELHAAVMKAFGNLQSEGKDIRLTDYTSHADLSSSPPHYVIYWELSNKISLNQGEGEECCYAMEESLSVVYHRGRVEKSIGALELKLVEPGTFDKVIDMVAKQGGSVAQYKTPRCIKSSSPVLQIAASGAYASYFSPRAPKY